LNNRQKGLRTTADIFRELQAKDPYIPPAWMLPPKVELPKQETIRYEEPVQYEERVLYEDSILKEEESGWDVNEDFTHTSEISMSTSPRIKIFTRKVPERKLNLTELSEYFGKPINPKLAAADRLWPEHEDEDEDDENRNTLRKLSRISMSPKLESPLDLADPVPEKLLQIPMLQKRESTSDLADPVPEKLPQIPMFPKKERTLNLADTAPKRLELDAGQDSTLDAFQSTLSSQGHDTCCERYHAQMSKLQQVQSGIRDVKDGLGRLVTNVPETTYEISIQDKPNQGRFAAMNKRIVIVCAVLVTLFLLECLLWCIYGRRTASTTNNWHPHDPWFGRCLGTKLNQWTGKVVTNTLVLIRDSINLIVDPDALRFRPMHPRTAYMGANDWWQGRSAPVGIRRRMDPGILSDTVGY